MKYVSRSRFEHMGQPTFHDDRDCFHLTRANEVLEFDIDDDDVPVGRSCTDCGPKLPPLLD